MSFKLVNGKYEYVPDIKNQVKDLAFRIMSQSAASYRSNGMINKAIKEHLKGEDFTPEYTGNFSNNRNLNALYIYGDETGFERLPDNYPGFDYKDYLKKTGYKPKTYKGEFGVNKPLRVKDTPLNRQLLHVLNGTHSYNHFLNKMSNNEGDNVGHYVSKIGQNKNGDYEFQQSDIWDFYPADYNKIWESSNLQSIFLDKIGTPFILRNNVPIVLDKNVEEDDIDLKTRASENKQKVFENTPDWSNIPLTEDAKGTTLPEVIVTAPKPTTSQRIKGYFNKMNQEFIDSY